MLSAAQRQAKLAADRSRVIVNKREQLYGQGDIENGYYTEEQCAHVEAVVNALTPDEFAAALAQANALEWASDDDLSHHDWTERRTEQW
jgi:hypothetical protein